MRDPDASLRLEGAFAIRELRVPLQPGDFLRSSLAHAWVDRGRMIPFRETTPQRVEAPRLPFVTNPDEWCDAQLWAAAKVTLELQADAVAHGFDLKDASAWNVIFDGVQPMLCDHTSVVHLTERRWWAAGQYARHFILPLLLSRRRGLRGHQSFAVWRDGVPPASAAAMLGPGRFLSRYWPLMAGANDDGRSVSRDAVDTPKPADIEAFRTRLLVSMTWMLEGVTADRAIAGSTWSSYTSEREHYATDSVQRKRSQVEAWLTMLKPGWVADLGCNDGEFSNLALATGAAVVSIDGDHDAVQLLFQRAQRGQRLYPVVAQLDDLPMGRGWAGTEVQGLAARLRERFDVVMMLAVIHHLAIAAAVPLPAIGRLAASMTTSWLIVELIGSDDVQLLRLCAQRGRTPEEFSMASQLQAFLDAGFQIQADVALSPAPRSLVLLKRT